MVIKSLTYAEFANAYRVTFDKMMSYTLTEVGSDIYCDQLAALADAYPDFLAQFEAELEAVRATA